MSSIKQEIRDVLSNQSTKKEKALELHKIVKKSVSEEKMPGVYHLLLSELHSDGDAKVNKALRLLTQSEIGFLDDSDSDLSGILRVVKESKDLNLTNEQEQALNKLIGLSEDLKRLTHN